MYGLIICLDCGILDLTFFFMNQYRVEIIPPPPSLAHYPHVPTNSCVSAIHDTQESTNSYVYPPPHTQEFVDSGVTHVCVGGGGRHRNCDTCNPCRPQTHTLTHTHTHTHTHTLYEPPASHTLHASQTLHAFQTHPFTLHASLTLHTPQTLHASQTLPLTREVYH